MFPCVLSLSSIATISLSCCTCLVACWETQTLHSAFVQCLPPPGPLLAWFNHTIPTEATILESSQDTSAEHSDSSLTSMQIIQVFSLLLGDPICCWHRVKEQCSDAHHSTSLGVQNYHSTDAVNFVL